MTNRRSIGIYESGLTELIGKDEAVAQNEYSGSVGVTINPDGATYPRSGEILAAVVISTEEGTGAVLQSTGTLIFLDADPGTSPGDTDLAVAEHRTMLGQMTYAATDYVADANGAQAYIPDKPIPFHNLSTVYLVWLHTLATGYNDGAGDDEYLHVNFWYRLDD